MNKQEAIELYHSGDENTVSMLITQSEKIKELEDKIVSVIKGSKKLNRNFCEGCFEKQVKIDRLEEEIKRLKAQLRRRERNDKEGYFGSSTPSSKKPLKENSLEENRKKRGGAKPGHIGHGRRSIGIDEAHRIEKIHVEKICPYCEGVVDSNGYFDRSLIDLPPIKAEKIIQKLEQGICSECGENFFARPRGVFPRFLYGNGLLAQTMTSHYLHGIPLGRISKIVKVDMDHLIGPFHRIAELLEPSVQRLIELYRISPVKHADETSWRTDGKSGYAWIFCNEAVTIFRFRDTRSAIVPKEIFGEKKLPGTLVVDRYNGYNQAPCKIQYCYEHLKRNVEDLGEEFPESEEVQNFVEHFCLLLAKAIKLRNRPIPDKTFYPLAKELKNKITKAVEAPSQHLGIQHIQDVFYENFHRMYHWADDRRIPAENNISERELRTTVIARKVSFGSQSETGAKTREILMTILHTLNKHVVDVATYFKETLDRLAFDASLDPYEVLFGRLPFFSDSRKIVSENPLSAKVTDGFLPGSESLPNENKVESSFEDSKLYSNQKSLNRICHKEKKNEQNMRIQVCSYRSTISHTERSPPSNKVTLSSQIIGSLKNIAGINLARWFAY